MPPLRVLVADDSAVSRRLIVHILESDPGLEVVGEAANGADAVRLAAELKPDVVTMDTAMPVVDGLEATRRIMTENPRPIVILSSSIDHPNTEKSLTALEAGALTILKKPAGPGSPQYRDTAAELIRTVKLMAEIKVVSRTSRRRRTSPPPWRPDQKHHRAVDIVAIAASTGGPAALAAILRELPENLRAPILIVQHIAPGFEKGFAAWLNGIAASHVRLAASGQAAVGGDILVAPADAHIEISPEGIVTLRRSKPIDGYRPSASHLFRSVARSYGARAVGVILTGMGSDGAAGLQELKQAGGLVLAQDEASSVVFGMPREAIKLGIVDEVLALDRIAQTLTSLAGRDAGPA